MAPALPRWARVPAAASILVVAAQALRVPPLVDAVSGRPFEPGRLEFPLGHLLSTPLSSWADFVTFNSARQHYALVAWLLAGCALLGLRWGPKRGLSALGGVLAFLVWAMLLPRPMARLALEDPGLLAVDFHSHTSWSHDGRSGFTPLRNVRWHARAGFSAGFITDHNRMEGALEARSAAPRPYRALLGEEVSLERTHVAVLGNRVPIDNRPYDGSREGVKRFLGDCERLTGGLPVLALPESWLHYWDRIDDVASWGAAGIEIVNAAPKALDFPPEARARAVELARRRGLFLSGVSDSHGWGSASYVWNVMRLPNQAQYTPEALQEAILQILKRDRVEAVSVVVRNKRSPSAGPSIVVDPALGIWTMLRTWTPAQAAVALLWVWLPAVFARMRAA